MGEVIWRHLVNYMNKTEKLFYIDPFATKCSAEVININETGIATNRTVAFPEGGGQVGDAGSLIFENKNIPFSDTKKGVGRMIFLPDFPTIQVDNQIFHVIDKEYQKYFTIGMKLEIAIDVLQRAKTTLAHTCIHLVLLSIQELRPNIYSTIKGCHITPDYARMDFATDVRFDEVEIQKIKELTNKLIATNAVVEVFPHAKEPEAWFWRCNGHTLPCGGTHLQQIGNIHEISLQRKNLGKNLERITVTFPNAVIPVDLYKENLELYHACAQSNFHQL